MEDLSLDIRETESPSLILEGQLLVVDASWWSMVAWRSDIHRIFGHVVAEIIGASIGHPPLKPPPATHWEKQRG